MITGVHEERFLQSAILPFPIKWPEVEELRARNLSVFSTPRAEQFGRDFQQFYRTVGPDRCEGKVDDASYVGEHPEDFAVVGWVIERQTGGPVKEVVMVAEGKIVGFGVPGPPRPDVANALHSDRALHSGWVGYAKLAKIGAVDLYGILQSLGHKDSCQFASVRIDSFGVHP
jgi:hypothetical protein